MFFEKRRKCCVKNNVVNIDFKNRKKTRENRSKRIISVMAVIGAFLVISGLVFSIICYIMS